MNKNKDTGRNEEFRLRIKNAYMEGVNRGDNFDQTIIPGGSLSIPGRPIRVIPLGRDSGYRVRRNVPSVASVRGGINVIGGQTDKNSIVRITIPKGTTQKMNSIPKEKRIEKTKKRTKLEDILLRLATVGVATTMLVILARGCNNPTIKAKTQNASPYAIENEQNVFDSYINKLQDENLSEEELKSMPKQIALILKWTIKPKLEETLGYPIDEIELISEPSPNLNAGSTEKFKVRYAKGSEDERRPEKKEETYIEDSEIPPFVDKIPFVGDFMKGNNTFGNDIAKVIYDIDRMNDLAELQKSGEAIDKDKVRRECIRALMDAKKLDGQQFKKDEKGNIIVAKRVKSLDYEGR